MPLRNDHCMSRTAGFLANPLPSDVVRLHAFQTSSFYINPTFNFYAFAPVLTN